MNLQQLNEAVAVHGGIRPAARELGMPESTLRTRLKKAMTELLATSDQQEFTFTSYRQPRPVVYEPLLDITRYFILTSAQDSSLVHEDFWAALQVYAEWLEDCEIIVSGFTYSKTLFEDHDTRSAKVGFHPSIDAFIQHERVRIGDEVEFCGEMNTLPTAVTPLSGFSTYTRGRWVVFPNPKVQLESVANMKNDRSKQLMTTGAVTLPNYIRKKAGIKASFHHQIGAVLVEMRSDGSTYCRHLLATDLDDGSFYDLDRKVTRDGVTEGHRVEAITFGDIHHNKLDPAVAMATWNYDVKSQKVVPGGFARSPQMSLVDYLRPNYGFFHDLNDFEPRNHHSIKDPYHRYKSHIKGAAKDNVKSELMGSASFLRETYRDDMLSVVVESNHDQALVKWLKEADYRVDPENALFFLECQQWMYRQMAAGVDNPDIFQHTLRELGAPDDVVFVNEDTGFVICGDIECGMHGHLGPNGARGSPLAISRAGMKSNTGHTHSPSIRDGAYVAGVSGKLDMGYNVGPSSWAQSHILTYANGKRTIITFHNGRFYA